MHCSHCGAHLHHYPCPWGRWHHGPGCTYEWEEEYPVLPRWRTRRRPSKEEEKDLLTKHVENLKKELIETESRLKDLG